MFLCTAVRLLSLYKYLLSGESILVKVRSLAKNRSANECLKLMAKAIKAYMTYVTSCQVLAECCLIGR